MKIKYILAISALTLSLNSCEDKLALTPEQDLTEEVIFNNAATTKSAVLGLYNTAQTLEFSGSLPAVIDEYMGDNVDWVGSFPTLTEIYLFSTISTNSNVSGLWQVHYQVITRANKIIAKVPGVPGLSQADKDLYLGEAKFMRALAYFQLVNMFAQPFQVSGGTNLGVPLVLEDFTGNITYPARATVNDVHAQIKKDLTESAAALGATHPDGVGRATKGAANALLARLNLYREDWAGAITAARAAIAGPYARATDYTFWDKNTAEDVFTIQNSATDNGRTGSGGWAAYYSPTAVGGRGDAPFSVNLTAAYNAEPADKRFALKRTGTAADGLSKTFTTKFPDAVTNADNSPVIRITEVYLTLAEALAQSSATPSAEAITIVNYFRNRAGLLPVAPLTKQATIDAVLLERRKELAFEGFRRMDMLRYKQNLRPGVAAAAFGAPKTILPIPQREIDQNPSLVPNPGF
ncbi:RagB/SusD family nutrient uptake outer membrane protein [Daejeonella lutea]|uniref:SusD family protein n=1 Tax=Daejeonella lutea TaxID=572036 RepID=A0A1T5B512_9SPHI|nr:RagB/SusD family nutrient uptake outer membrane protein [Daejeonella lutea]SKB42003.1 SusD family protein [Daejeonella lutea]